MPDPIPKPNAKAPSAGPANGTSLPNTGAASGVIGANGAMAGTAGGAVTGGGKNR
jgi:hypothetical protein